MVVLGGTDINCDIVSNKSKAEIIMKVLIKAKKIIAFTPFLFERAKKFLLNKIDPNKMVQ